MTALADLFPDADYRFHLTLRRGEPRDFFASQDPSGRVLAERARWIAADSERYVAWKPAGAAAVHEFAGQAVGWLRRPDDCPPAAPISPSTRDQLVALGSGLEPDVLFLAADDDGKFRLQAGALCFPTGWALEEKIGLPMDVIHGVVPGLNAALASPIHQFLTRLRPGQAYLRDNWGIAATAELNLHPCRRMPAPTMPVTLDRLWLRVEHQALFSLPASGAIVFGIRIALHRMDAVARDPAAAGLRRALESMPEELAAYKRLDGIRSGVIRAL